jgi:hypothetical protein
LREFKPYHKRLLKVKPVNMEVIITPNKNAGEVSADRLPPRIVVRSTATRRDFVSKIAAAISVAAAV